MVNSIGRLGSDGNDAVVYEKGDFLRSGKMMVVKTIAILLRKWRNRQCLHQRTQMEEVQLRDTENNTKTVFFVQ